MCLTETMQSDAVPLTAMAIWRRGHGLKSHPTDWWSWGSSPWPLVYKACGLSTTPQRLQWCLWGSKFRNPFSWDKHSTTEPLYSLWRPRWNAAFFSISYGSPLFASTCLQVFSIQRKQWNPKLSQQLLQTLGGLKIKLFSRLLLQPILRSVLSLTAHCMRSTKAQTIACTSVQFDQHLYYSIS